MQHTADSSRQQAEGKGKNKRLALTTLHSHVSYRIQMRVCD